MSDPVAVGAAFAPLVVGGVLLGVVLWPAERSMPVAWLVAATVGVAVREMPASWVAAVSIRGGLVALENLWVVFGALVVLYTLVRSEAVDRINEEFPRSAGIDACRPSCSGSSSRRSSRIWNASTTTAARK